MASSTNCYYFCVFFIAYFANLGINAEDLVQVTTDSGKLLGKTSVDRKGESFYSFQSIPYAKPPVADLRFKDPEPALPWEGVLNATQQSPICPQVQDDRTKSKILGQEDCLYLNVFTPQILKENEDKKDSSLLPVMVFIHGGGFRSGWSYEYTNPEFLISEKVVLVTINYRLGFLGFLNFVDESLDVPGNAGMKDQVLALKWIKNNIKYFGGNPDSITIFGESAGAGAVHLLVLSPMAKGLFHRAIAQSGSALNLWAKGKKDNARIIGQALGFNTEDNAQLLEALKKVSLEKFLNAQNGLWPNLNISTQLDASVIVETQTKHPAFLAQEPSNLIKSGAFNAVPMIFGYNSDEGLLLHINSWLSNKRYNIITNFEKYLPYDLRKKPEKIAEIADKVKKFYYKNQNDSKGLQPTTNFMTDTWFYKDIFQAVSEQSKAQKSPVYFYKFTADTKLNFFKRQVPDLADYPGTSHVDELGYLFKNKHTPEIVPGSPEDIGIKRMVKLWTNFARFGNPTPTQDSLLDSQIWQPHTPDAKQLFEIGNKLNASADIDFKPITFWKNLYANYA